MERKKLVRSILGQVLGIGIGSWVGTVLGVTLANWQRGRIVGGRVRLDRIGMRHRQPFGVGRFFRSQAGGTEKKGPGGKGIVTEAFRQIIPFFFEQVGVNRICAQHDPNNPGSGKVMVKSGLRYEGTLRQADYNNRGVADAAVYGILAEEYRPEDYDR